MSKELFLSMTDGNSYGGNALFDKSVQVTAPFITCFICIGLLLRFIFCLHTPGFSMHFEKNG